MIFTHYYYNCYYLFSFLFSFWLFVNCFDYCFCFSYFKCDYSCMYFWFYFYVVPGFPRISWNLVIDFLVVIFMLSKSFIYKTKRTATLSNLHQWLIRWFNLQSKVVSRRYFFILYCPWCKFSRKLFKWWFNPDK